MTPAISNLASTRARVLDKRPASQAELRPPPTPARGEYRPMRPEEPLVAYAPGLGLDNYLRAVAQATPMAVIDIEREGVPGLFIKDLSRRMAIPTSRFFAILGLPKATAEKKAAAGELVNGSSGQAAVGITRLIGIAQAIADQSTSSAAENFDAAKWLGRWIESPQPALGGRKPADLVSTPTGLEIVSRLLGAMESGAYQ